VADRKQCAIHDISSRRRNKSIAKKLEAPSFLGAFDFNWATSYSPTHLARAVPSGLKGLTTVFGMGTGGTPSLQSPKIV
jgi:hypothetical protein